MESCEHGNEEQCVKFVVGKPEKEGATWENKINVVRKY
jgi:hypothetical protein